MGIMEEDFVEGEASYSEDIDSEYEFDAPHFYDFSLDDSESEADSWFRYAHEYPPSPFIVKMKFMKAAKSRSMKAYKTNSRKKEDNRKTSTSSNSDCEIDHKPTSREMKIKGVKHPSHTPRDTMKAKINLSKPSGPSFMKPTASHLAKQNKRV